MCNIDKYTDILLVILCIVVIVKTCYIYIQQNVHEHDAVKEEKHMKFGTLYSYWDSEWKCDYEQVMKKVSSLGFDILEMGAPHLVEMSDNQLSNLKKTAERLNITLTSNIGPAKDKDIASSNPAIRKAGISYLKDIMKAMDKIGSRVLAGAMYSYWPCDFEEIDKESAWVRSIESMKEISKTAEELGIDCCLEVLNRYETYIMTDCEEGLEYCQKVESENVNLLLDTFHMNIEEDNIMEAIKLAGDRLGHLHVGEANRKLPGMGSLPWKEIGNALKEIGYNKGIVMEPFLISGGAVGKDIKVWRDLSCQADTNMLDQYIKESLQFLKSQFC